MKKKKTTVQLLSKMKRQGEKITMITCYDATFARLLSETEIEIILVGDSLGMVIQGHDTTLPVTLEEIIYHTRSVIRGLKSDGKMVVADLPFLSYQTSKEDAIRAAGRCLKEGYANAVKLEGARWHLDSIKQMVDCGIPVMGHIGLTPQSVQAFGGFKTQGKTEEQAEEIYQQSLLLQEAGCFSVVLEGIPSNLAGRISNELRIPTIGIGAGADCDGQVLVLQDMLGLNPDFKPKFLKHYQNFAKLSIEAFNSFDKEVKESVFPGPENSITS